MMNNCFIGVFILLLLNVGDALHPALKHFDSVGCRSELKRGIQTLQQMSERLSEHEKVLRDNKLNLIRERIKNTKFEARSDGKLDASTCPPLPPSVYPPPEQGFAFPSIFPYRSEEDVFVKYMNYFAEILKDEESVCNGPPFQSFASVTMEQIYGFGAIFATNYAKPLCPICREFVQAIRDNFMDYSKNSLSQDEIAIADILLAHVPSAETLCSMLLPSCHENLLASSELAGGPKTTPNPDPFNSTHCFKCQFCMTGTMLLEHKFLNNQDAIDILWFLLSKSLVPNLCTELCNAYPAGQPTSNKYWPNGVDYDTCMSTAYSLYYNGTVEAVRFLFPNTFCPTFKFCEQYETPNILHCLKAYCMDLQGGFTLLKPVCDLLPDHPDQVDQYLNIRQKGRKQEGERKRATDGEKRDEL